MQGKEIEFTSSKIEIKFAQKIPFFSRSNKSYGMGRNCKLKTDYLAAAYSMMHLKALRSSKKKL
jgi:hypothetical protein